ncbi:MAG TPA: EAL domain-containing protein [Acetobacteraceae bacterium]|nr:EAL domain-containing protein [Acetobacteraceae bacterium]
MLELATPNAGDLLREVADLKAQSLRFGTALENLVQGVCFFDGEQRLILSNRRYWEIYNLPPDRLGPGVTLHEVILARIAVGSFPAEEEQPYLAWRVALADQSKPHDSVVELRDGRVIAIHHRPMPDRGWVSTHEDITERRRAEDRIVHLASHDPLTGLGNRALFQARLVEVRAACARAARSWAVLYVDLDDFKAANDTLGHAQGDAVLQLVAERLRRLVRRGDSVARLGGDEFGVLAPDVNGEAEAAQLSGRIVAGLAEPFALGGRSVCIGACVGAALARPDHDASPEQLLRWADMALYQAKADGRSTYRVFRPELETAWRARQDLEHELRAALDRGEFELHYQPLIALPGGEIGGVEALLRWNHPTRGIVPPAEFLPLAEETGLILPIGEWVLRSACRQGAAWSRVRMAVNLSPLQLQAPGLVPLVEAVLAETGLEPGRLELEITETALLRPLAGIVGALDRLRGIGVRVVIDDFGTGYSSLAYLQNLPCDKLKIDRSFVCALGDASVAPDRTGAIVQAIVSLCRAIGVEVNAEGVETAAQEERLRLEGCGEMQGFRFGRPMPASAMSAVLRGEAEPA